MATLVYAWTIPMRAFPILAAILATGSIPGDAQPSISAKAGLISYSEGEVFVNGRAIETSPVRPRQMLESDVIRSRTGRAEVLLNPCVVLHVDENTSIRIVASRLMEARVELQAGSIVVPADGNAKNAHTVVGLTGTSVAVNHEGRYRFDVEMPRLKVFAGKAALERGALKFTISAGWSVPLDSPSKSAVVRFKTQDQDALDSWSQLRISALIRASGSADQASRQRLENQEAARKAAELDAQTRDPRSVQYDPLAPPQARSANLPIAPPVVAHFCPALSK